MLFRKKNLVLALMVSLAMLCIYSFSPNNDSAAYKSSYDKKLQDFTAAQTALLRQIEAADVKSEKDVASIKEHLQIARNHLKTLDFWFRYLEPIAYRKINGPLPVEWETEVFEKFEAPYRREGAGLTLAALYLEEEDLQKDSLTALIKTSIEAVRTFKEDSITLQLNTYSNFYLCNRMFLLNLAAIYTTGFECPDTTQVIPELLLMLNGVHDIYRSFNTSFPESKLPDAYLSLYQNAIRFVETQPATYSAFDHFSLIQKFINPLFLFNQKLINQYRVTSRSLVDYSLNKKEITIFDKALFSGQNSKGIFHRITNPDALAEVERLGKLLFFDPILSGNNQRSCASCHNPATFFTDTIATTSFKFNREGFLGRNTPSLINAQYNHLLMSDGRHILLQDQTKGVLINAEEMNCSEKEVVEKVLSCPDYRTGFKQLLKYTPTEKEISIDHIVSAVTLYYSTLSQYYSPFDRAINSDIELDASAKKGFNLFMSKAQCATCHFVPQFNGVKPPYTGSEFEVLGTPSDSSFSSLSSDMGRYSLNPAAEMKNAFRTGTVRNAAFTAPYMHNGVFRNLKQVIDFYDAGGGAGRGLQVPNQTLSPEGLRLTEEEKYNLIKFIHSLSEVVPVVKSPEKLPRSEIKSLNNRKAGGEY